MKTPLIVFYKDINEKGFGVIDLEWNIDEEDWHVLVPLNAVLKRTVAALDARISRLMEGGSDED